MRINNNIMALNAHRQLAVNQTNGAKSMERLSSGMRINRAGDDAAGLAISEKMRGQIRGLKQAQRNAQDGISLIQTAEGALNEIHSILQRMRELATQSATDTNIGVDRNEIQKEIDQLAQEITRISNSTEFNQQTLLNGGIQEGAKGKLTFHIGANEGQDVSLAIKAMDAASLGVAGVGMSVGVDTTATAISSGEINGTTGSALVDGAMITVSVADNTGTAASGELAIGTKALGAKANAVGTGLNGVTIKFAADSDATISTSWDGATSTLTVAADWNNSGGSAPASIAAVESAINEGLASQGLGPITLNAGAGTESVTVAELDAAGSLVLGDGTDANANETIVTVTNGVTTQSIVVSDSATSVNFASGAFKGLTLNTSDVTTMAGVVTVATTLPTAATFDSTGELVNKAETTKGIDVSTQSAASKAITTIQNAIESVSAERSKLGAMQNRLEHTIANLGTSAENLQAAESRIRDLDMAEEIMAFTKNNILQQAATAMLAQANMAPQSVLQLLG